jgi:hypothetical protein
MSTTDRRFLIKNFTAEPKGQLRQYCPPLPGPANSIRIISCSSNLLVISTLFFHIVFSVPSGRFPRDFPQTSVGMPCFTHHSYMASPSQPPWFLESSRAKWPVDVTNFLVMQYTNFVLTLPFPGPNILTSTSVSKHLQIMFSLQNTRHASPEQNNF